MEVGIFSRTYETGDLDETFRRMKAHGIRHTQFNFSNCGLSPLPAQIDDPVIDLILTKTREYDIRIDALTGTFNMIDPDSSARDDAIDQFKRQLAAAHALGIPMVTLCTGSRSPHGKWTWDDANLEPSAWQDLLATTDRIIREAEDLHILLGVETEASNVVCSPELARKYLDCIGSPNLKIIMDGANLFRPEQVPDMDRVLRDAFDLLGRDIALAHAKDLSFDGDISFVGAGQGVLNFPLYIDLLKKSGYEGALIMHGQSEVQTPDSKTYLENLLYCPL